MNPLHIEPSGKIVDPYLIRQYRKMADDIVKQYDIVSGQVGVKILSKDSTIPDLSGVIQEFCSLSKDKEFSISVDLEPSLVFGKGTVMSHRDSITNVTLLVALEGVGQLHSDNVFVDVNPQDCVIFDDRDLHAWLSNTRWMFLAQPLYTFPRIS